MEDSSPHKVAFASPAWIAAAREILEALVAAHGRPGRRFSLCERFTDPPPELSATGEVAWHFRIDGSAVEVGAGAIGDADVTITADYEKSLPAARLVYTPEVLAQRSPAAPRPGVQGDLASSPGYLVELHNQLAAITA